MQDTFARARTRPEGLARDDRVSYIQTRILLIYRLGKQGFKLKLHKGLKPDIIWRKCDLCNM